MKKTSDDGIYFPGEKPVSNVVKKRADVDTSNLHIGVYGSYKELCAAVGEAPTSSNSKNAQLARWSRYFDYRAIDGTNKYEVVEIYTDPLPKVPQTRDTWERSGYYKFASELLFLAFFKQTVDIPNIDFITLDISDTKLCEFLGFAQRAFFEEGLEKEANRVHIWEEGEGENAVVRTEYQNHAFHETYSIAKGRMLQILRQVLKKFDDMRLIMSTPVVKVIRRNSKGQFTHEDASLLEAKKIHEAEGIAMKAVGVQRYGDVLRLPFSRQKKYRECLQAKLDAIGVTSYYRIRRLTILSNVVRLHAQDRGYNPMDIPQLARENGLQLNRNVCESVRASLNHAVESLFERSEWDTESDSVISELSEESGQPYTDSNGIEAYYKEKMRKFIESKMMLEDYNLQTELFKQNQQIERKPNRDEAVVFYGDPK